MYEDIVVPIDGSKTAKNAIKHAVEVAKGRDATVHVIYVIDDRAFVGDMDWSPVRDELMNQAQETTREGVRMIEEYDDRNREVDVVTMEEIREGVPHEEILDYCEEVDADLVVMGTHGRTGLEKVALGSVTEKVLRSSKVPVLSVASGGEE
ncbi:MAG: universal stress protein [Candidatus Nanohaloarchaea archaeon]